MFYGPGGTGKSTLISVIENVFKGCCATIKSSVLTERRLDLKTQTDTDKAVASNRILTVGEMNLATSDLNIHTVKELTGHDSVFIPPVRVATNCSVIAACNNLLHPEKQSDWIMTSVTRRNVVILCNVKFRLIPKRQQPGDEEDILDFLIECVSIYLLQPCMP